MRTAAEQVSSAAMDRMPTLTEVVEWRAGEPGWGRALPAPFLLAPAPSPSAIADPDQVPAIEFPADLLFELEGRVSLALEARLRAALTPILARAADAMVCEAKQELSATLRACVEEAVNRALERHSRV